MPARRLLAVASGGRFLNSNRQTYEKLELDATRRKKSERLISNRRKMHFSSKPNPILAHRLFDRPLMSANRTQRTHSVIQAGAPIQPYATQSKPLSMIEANKRLIGRKTPVAKYQLAQNKAHHFL
jgi:hypothetical protein